MKLNELILLTNYQALSNRLTQQKTFRKHHPILNRILQPTAIRETMKQIYELTEEFDFAISFIATTRN